MLPRLRFGKSNTEERPSARQYSSSTPDTPHTHHTHTTHTPHTHHTHTHIYRECKVIQRHVVRAADPLQLAAVPVLDSRVRDALTEPVFDKSA